MNQKTSYVKILLSAIVAGGFIGIGGTAFLSLDNKVIGSVFFTIGLFAICSFGLHLYTGKVCYVFDNKPEYLLTVLVTWIGNLIGTNLLGFLMLQTRINGIAEKAAGICEAKLNDNLVSIFILACFCNMMIWLGVEGYKNFQYELGKYLALFFGVCVFIVCGFEHCIANMFYFAVAGAWSGKAVLYLMVMTLGNAVGGVLLPLCMKTLKTQ